MNQEKLWEYYQNDPEIGDMAFGAHARYRTVASKIEPGSRLLNIGVGRGDFEEILVRKGVIVHCLDPSETSIMSMRAGFNLEDRAKAGYSQAIPFEDQSFDVVVMTEVLEHLSDEVLKQTLSEVRRVILPGGRFIATVPANESLVESNVVCPDCGKVFHRWGHLQEFSDRRLKELFEPEYPKVVIERVHFSNWADLNWKGRFAYCIKRLTIFLGIKGQGESFLLTAIKAE